MKIEVINRPYVKIDQIEDGNLFIRKNGDMYVKTNFYKEHIGEAACVSIRTGMLEELSANVYVLPVKKITVEL